MGRHNLRLILCEVLHFVMIYLFRNQKDEAACEKSDHIVLYFTTHVDTVCMSQNLKKWSACCKNVNSDDFDIHDVISLSKKPGEIL